MIYQIVQDKIGMFYVLKKNEVPNICIFYNKWVFGNLEILYFFINKHFHNQRYGTFEKEFDVISTFETIEEFREKFAEYLI
jgi:hypothetical protein